MTVSRLTPSSKPSSTRAADRVQTYSVPQLFTALSRLGVLPPLLRDLQARLIRAVVHPLVDGEASHAERIQSSSSDTLQLNANPHQQPIDVVNNLKDVLLFVANQVYPPPSSEPETAIQQQFVSEIRGESFRYVLDHLLLPAMPTSTSRLPAWVDLVHQSAEWEQQLAKGTHSTTVLGSFLDTDAGERWILERQRVLLRQGRRFVYEGWAAWTWKDVEVKETEPTISAAVAEVTEPEMGDDDGWGFDEDDQQPPRTEPSAVVADDSEENDGWDFDDEAPTVSQPVVPKKPVKEARRLGKKVGSKPAPPSEERLSDTEQHPVPTPSPRAASPLPSATRGAAAVSISKPSTYRISTICDEVLAMAADLGKDIESFSKLK